MIWNPQLVFDYVHLLYYKCNKINQSRGGSYKAKINHINRKDNNCSQYVVAVALNHEEIKKRSIKNYKN